MPTTLYTTAGEIPEMWATIPSNVKYRCGSIIEPVSVKGSTEEKFPCAPLTTMAKFAIWSNAVYNRKLPTVQPSLVSMET